ncbi:MAG: asparagine synthase (glutamine-hydrolyzing) [Candidatus Aminicenantes bacterium]|nr:MAG: asparagine synthase (glutamine-hydrolyzing) [Candidatus Aminicenantes bacterium]
MCGIAGILNRKKGNVSKDLLESMAITLSHRGPDGEKFMILNSQNKKWSLLSRNEPHDTKGDIGFAHRRLSIIDLSELASQPMSDEENNIWIVHNGEIFNYLEIKEDLIKLGHRFRTQSDTEVIIEAYKEYGKDCLGKLNGMWAFVLYDLKRNTIFGARDRFGIKPFYYHSSDEYFAFSSEIKALLRLPWVSREPFLPVIKDYLYYSRVNTSKFTFFKGIYELEAGHLFEIDLNAGFHLKISKWWDLRENLSPLPENKMDKFEKFRELLLSSIKLRLRSDVPVGTCLSGGLDSSAIVSLANPFLDEGNQKTFSAVHPGYKLDESTYVDEIAKNYNVIPYKLSFNGKNLLNDLEDLLNAHDEPFTSTSIYAQWKVFQFAKQNGVTVTLDGQGADELLAGYPYFKIAYWSELIQKLDIARLFGELSSESISIPQSILSFFMSFSGFLPHRRMIALAELKDPQYRTNWINKYYFKKTPLPPSPIKRTFISRLNQRLYEIFTCDGLPGLIRYADRNSMAHSLESRMPFLDYRLVSYVFSLSSDSKINNGLSKYILRKALMKDIPAKISERRDKIGFETPEAEWFRDELRSFMADIVHSKSLKNRNYYDVNNLKRLLEKHSKGTINASRPLWRAINLELWHRKYID